MAMWIHTWFEHVDHDWGKSGGTICSECGGLGRTAYNFCPWCGRAINGCETKVIIVKENKNE